MKYERLTERDKDGKINVPLMNAYYIMQAYDRLAELEDKIESGKMIELPCKVGDTMYGISSPLHIEKAKLSEVCYEVVTRDGHHLIGNLGISLFTDKSQAETRLKELQGE